MSDLKAPTWDANLYLKFVDARLRPALDLMGRLDPANAARPGHAIYDLGCGAGNITRILAERFPEPPVIGVDSSEEMLAKARSQTADKHVSFTKGDLAHSSRTCRRASSTATPPTSGSRTISTTSPAC